MYADVLHIALHWIMLANMRTPPHLTVAEFAARMSMEPHMVRRRIRQGKIRAINISDDSKPEYRISEAELTRWTAERTVKVA